MTNTFFDGFSVPPSIEPGPGGLDTPAADAFSAPGPQEKEDSCFFGSHQGLSPSNLTEYDMNGDGRIDRLSIDVNQDGIADVEINSVPGLVRGAAFPSLVGCELPDTENSGLIGGGAVLGLNGDGIGDALALDISGDGRPDAMGIDTTGDGIADLFGVDLNGDGIIDAMGVGVDLNGDGIPDGVGVDLDGDGVVDKIFGPDDF